MPNINVPIGLNFRSIGVVAEITMSNSIAIPILLEHT